MNDELPQGRAATLGGIAELVSGAGFPTDYQNRKGLPLPFFKVGNLGEVGSAQPLVHSEHTVSPETARELRARVIPPHSVVFAKIGMAIALNRRRLLGKPACIDNNMMAAIPNEAVVLGYLHKFLETLDFMPLSQATTVPSLRKGDLEKLAVLLPPLAEQRRIVAKLKVLLGQVDACQNRLEKIPVLIKRFRQSVLAAACSGRLTEDWREENPAEAADLEFEEAPFAVPDSWQWTTFEKVSCEITVGYVGPMAKEYVDSGVPFLRSLNVRRFRFDPTGLKFIRPEFHEQIRKSKLGPGDVAVVRSGSSGVCCVIPESLPEANCSDLVIVRPKAEMLSDYACIFLNSNFAQAHIESAKVGIAQRHFNVGSMKKTLVPLPPLAEQEEIVRRVESLFALANNIEQRYKKSQTFIDKLTPSLLAKAFRGELVPAGHE